MNSTRFLKRVLITVLIIYIAIGLFLFFSQKSLLYFPTNQNFNDCIGFENYEKLNYNGTRFYFKEDTLKDNIIVYYHGNAGSACDRSAFKSVFEEGNSSVIFVEYAGYSNDNKNNPSRDLILQDVENMYSYVEEENFQEVLVYGKSIGSGAASYHAYLGNVDYLILTTPFSSLEDVAQSKYIIYPANLILQEKYNNINWLKNYNNSFLIVHGDSDRVIPHYFSQELFEEVSTIDKNYILIENRGHNDIWFSFEFKKAISQFINKSFNKSFNNDFNNTYKNGTKE